MALCAVPFCNNNNPAHRIPKDPDLRKTWLEAINIEPSDVTIDTSICWRHFLDSDYTYVFKEALLKETAVPSQNLEPNKRKKSLEPPKRISKRKMPLFGFSLCDVARKPTQEVGIDLPADDERKSKKSVTIDIQPNLLPEPESDSDEQIELTTAVNQPVCRTFEEITIKVERVHSEEDDNCTQDIYNPERVIKQEIDDEAEGCSSQTIEVDIDCKPLHVNVKSEEYLNLLSPIGEDGLKIEYFEDDDPSKQLEFNAFTGLDNYKQFVLLFSSLGPSVNNFLFRHQTKILSYKMKPEDQFLLTLIKLRLNLPNKVLAKKFVVLESTASQIFSTWINFLHCQYLKKQMWEDLDVKHCINCTDSVLLKCVVMPIERPKNDIIDSLSRSPNGPNTLKVLLGLSCKGILTAVSFAYGGLLSDYELFMKFGYRNLLEKNKKALLSRGFEINKLKKRENVFIETNHKTSHAEIIFDLGQTYKILNEMLPADLIPLTSRIIFTCFMLVNFKSHIPG